MFETCGWLKGIPSLTLCRIVMETKENSKEAELLHTGLELEIVGCFIKLMKRKMKCTFFDILTAEQAYKKHGRM